MAAPCHQTADVVGNFFFVGVWKVLILCDFFNLGCLRTNAKSHSVSIFLLMIGLVNFICHIMKILNFDNKLAFNYTLVNVSVALPVLRHIAGTSYAYFME